MTPTGVPKELDHTSSTVSPLGQVEIALTSGLEPARASVAHLPKPILRYSGFEQTGNVRTYLFDHLVTGQKSTPMAVSAEIPLLMKYHVSIQDGPALCLQVLSAAVGKLEAADASEPSRELTEDDIVAYLASKPKPPESKSKREKPATA